jgi:ABC transporter substrate binding protein
VIDIGGSIWPSARVGEVPFRSHHGLATIRAGRTLRPEDNALHDSLYGVSFTDLYRRAASYVDKILKGKKPAELPVEQPRKFEFIVSLKAAKQIGLAIPPNVLARADRVIK